MNNEEKALEIARLKSINGNEKYENPFRFEIYEQCLKMAAWKQEQMIEKAVSILRDEIKYHDIYEESDIETFIRRMME